MFDDLDVVANMDCGRQEVRESSLASECKSQILSQMKNVTTALVQKDKSLSDLPSTFSRRSKLGISGRSGGLAAKALSWYRHFCKSYKKARHTEATVLDALVALQQKVRTGKGVCVFNAKRLRKQKHLRAKHSLVLQAKVKAGAGNQHDRKFGMADFCEVAFGEKDRKAHTRFHMVGQIAKHFNISRPMVSRMRTTVASSIMTKQMHLLARILSICRKSAPVMVATRHAWDETAQDIQVQLDDQQGPSRGTWKVMVQKLKITIKWTHCSFLMDLVGILVVCSLLLFNPRNKLTEKTIGSRQ